MDTTSSDSINASIPIHSYQRSALYRAAHTAAQLAGHIAKLTLHSRPEHGIANGAQLIIFCQFAPVLEGERGFNARKDQLLLKFICSWM